jgi:hypothetical protein
MLDLYYIVGTVGLVVKVSASGSEGEGRANGGVNWRRNVSRGSRSEMAASWAAR